MISNKSNKSGGKDADFDEKLRSAIKKHNKIYPQSKIDDSKLDKKNTSTEEKDKIKATAATRIASELIASPLVGAFLGHLIDQKFESIKPLGLAIGFILGVAAAFFSLYRITKKM